MIAPANSTWALIGGVLAYLGAGFLVELMREASENHPVIQKAGWVSLAVGSAYILGEAIALFHGGGTEGYLLYPLGVCALILVPFGLELISQQALDRFVRDFDRDNISIGGKTYSWRRVTGFGFLLTALIVVPFGFFSHSMLSWLILAGCALIVMMAVVSNTHADVVIFLCVLALLSVSPVEVSLPEASGPGAQQADLLALGDSYMSGEGAKTFVANTDEAGKDTCRRAPTAYAALAVGAGRRFNHVTFLACSGARTYNVMANGDPQDGEPATQVDEIRKQGASYRPKLAIVSLGGNDAGFSTIGRTCLAPGNCDSQRALFEANLPQVHAALMSAYKSIRSALPGTPVVAVPYPQPLADHSCKEIALSASERRFIREFLIELNQTVRLAAQQAGFYYMDTMENALAAEHRQLCDPRNHGQPGVNFVSLESVSGLAEQRFNPANWLHDSLHPNELGHQAMLSAFDAWLNQHPQLPVHPSAAQASTASATGGVARATAGTPAPPCSITATSDTCQTLADHWALARFSDLWPYSVVLLIGLIGLWLMSVGLVSRLPRPERKLPDLDSPALRMFMHH
jgi:lysophospholipase L1-like esterase